SAGDAVYPWDQRKAQAQPWAEALGRRFAAACFDRRRSRISLHGIWRYGPSLLGTGWSVDWWRAPEFLLCGKARRERGPMVTEPVPLSPQRQPEDQDAALRPQTLGEFVGQEAARENLRVFIEAARGRGEAMDHVL